MIIRLVTIRNIPDEMLGEWIRAVKPGMFWIDEKYLRKQGKQTYVSTEEIFPNILTRAETTVEIT